MSDDPAIDPASLVRQVDWDGEVLTLRPVRPDDVDRINAGLAQCSLEDIYFRFGTGMPRLPPHLARRLTELDYSQHMALLALDAQEQVLGVARLVCDPGCATAEFALIVRSDKQHLGLGALLLEALEAFAARRGVREIWGDIAHENTRMRRFVQDHGFRYSPSEDVSRVRVIKPVGPAAV